MKTKLFLLLLLLVFSTLIFGQRRVLLEEGTNTGCPDCVVLGPKVHDLWTRYYGTLIPLQYHAWWPANNDPFYLYNVDQNTDRIEYYADFHPDSWFVPIVYLNGYRHGEPLSTDEVLKQALALASEHAKVDLSVSVDNNEKGELSIDVKMIALDEIDDTNLKLRVAIIEREYVFDQAPNINGFDHFGAVMRQVIPSTAGEPVDFAAKADTLDFNFTVPVDDAWNMEEVYAVAWLQSDDTREVLQVNMNFPTYVVESNDSWQDFMTPNSNYSKGYTITNNNETPLNVRLKYVIESNDANWVVKITRGGVLYDSLDVTIDPGRTIDFRLSVTTSNTQGEIKVEVFAQNLDDPYGYGNSYPYYGLLANRGVLLVDNDGELKFEEIYKTVFDEIQVEHATIPRSLFQQFFADKSSLPFDVVVWNNSNNKPSLDTTDVKILQNYLDDGGRLLFTGQSVGKDIFETAGTSYIPEVQNFYNNYLGAQFVQDNAGVYDIVSVPGVSIMEGIDFSLFAVYPRNPDAISSNTKVSSEILQYSGSDFYAAVINETEDYKTCLLGFSIEQITPSSIRAEFMQRIMDYFDIYTDISNSEETIIPEKYQLSQNYPNPFNPNTTIKYSLPENSFVNLKVYDVTGREVSELVNGEKQAGNYIVNFSAQNLPSGIYFYTLISGNFSDTKKMVILK